MLSQDAVIDTHVQIICDFQGAWEQKKPFRQFLLDKFFSPIVRDGQECVLASSLMGTLSQPVKPLAVVSLSA